MQIIDNKALLFATRSAAQITSLIPQSKVLASAGEVSKVLVKWGPQEFQILQNLRVENVPHPILGQYKWAGVDPPFEHQKISAAFMASHRRCFNLSEAGTGKTRTCAWAADYLMQIGAIRRVLIVCPVSIMETAWVADLFRTVMHRKVAMAVGNRKQRIAVINGDYEFVVINFDGFKSPLMEKALLRGGFDLIIVDEANAVKNPGTERWRALDAIIKPDTWLWLMTGTPAAQSPVDAYGLAKLVNPQSVPRFIGAFRDQVMIKVSQFRYIPRIDAQDTVFKVLQPAIRYTKAECLDLPELLYTTREVPMTKQQQHYYEVVRKNMAAMAAGEEITAANAAGLLNKLLQIAQGAAYSTDREVVEFDVSNRFNELLDVIHNTQHKVVVFVPYRHVMEVVADKLAQAGIAHAMIHGAVSAGQRADHIKAFQTEHDPRVLLIIPQAAAHGVTLTRADTVVWWGPTPSAELYLQGNARAHRAGQTNRVTVVRLQGSPVERKLYGLLDGNVRFHLDTVALFRQEIEGN